MALDSDAAFSAIKRTLEDFSVGVNRAQDDQVQAQETLDAVEYELKQLRKLIAENALSQPGPAATVHHLPDTDVRRELDPEAQVVHRQNEKAA